MNERKNSMMFGIIQKCSDCGNEINTMHDTGWMKFRTSWVDAFGTRSPEKDCILLPGLSGKVERLERRDLVKYPILILQL